MKNSHLLSPLLLLTPCFLTNVLAQSKALVKTGSAAMPEAQRAEVPTKVGAWQLVRYVSGENAHFLYANGPRTFSLFVTDTKNNRPLKAQPGWKPVGVQANVSAFMHQDTRNPERTAIVFKHQTQRRMIMGKLSEAVLVRLAKLLR